MRRSALVALVAQLIVCVGVGVMIKQREEQRRYQVDSDRACPVQISPAKCQDCLCTARLAGASGTSILDQDAVKYHLQWQTSAPSSQPSARLAASPPRTSPTPNLA